MCERPYGSPSDSRLCYYAIEAVDTQDHTWLSGYGIFFFYYFIVPGGIKVLLLGPQLLVGLVLLLGVLPQVEVPQYRLAKDNVLGLG